MRLAQALERATVEHYSPAALNDLSSLLQQGPGGVPDGALPLACPDCGRTA